MALFEGEEIVDVTTPDGRTLRLPRSAIPSSMMPQQVAQAPTGFADETVLNVTPPDVPSVTGGQLPLLDPDTGTAMQDAPIGKNPPAAPADVPIGKVDNTDAAVAKSNKAYDKQQKAEAAYAASPEAERARVEQQTQGAIADEQAAVEHAARVDGAAQDVLARAKEQHDQKIDGYIEDKARVANERYAEEERLLVKQDGLAKKIANTKIDRKADHPILAAISIALAGLGSAMQNRYTGQAPSMAALEVFWKAIDRKVANQMADLDLMEKTYGLQKDALAAYKEMTGRKLEVHNIMIAGEADKAKRHLETIIAKSASEQTKANAKILMAQIDQRAAAARQDAFRWGREYDQKERAEKNQNTRFAMQLKQADRHHADDVQLKREEMAFDAAQALAATKAKGDELAYKAELELISKNDETGLVGANGDYLLKPEGQKKMARAAQLEEQARQLEEAGKADPMAFSVKGGKGEVESLRRQASELRGSARLHDVARHRDKTQAGAFSTKLAAAQTVTEQLDDIRALYAANGGRDYFFTDEGRAKLQAAFNALAPTLKETWGLGSWDAGAARLVERIIGGDPSSVWTSVKNLEEFDAFLGRLSVIQKNIQTGVHNELTRQTTWKGKPEEIFASKRPNPDTPEGKAVAELSKGKTPLEREEAAKSGWLRRNVIDAPLDAARAVGSAVGGYDYESSDQARVREAAESGSIRYPGVGRDQEPALETLLNAYKSGNDKAGEQLVATIVNTAADRPQHAIGVLRNMEHNAPRLYAQASAAITNGPVAKYLEDKANTRIALAQLDTPLLVQQGRVTGWADPAMKADLVRRASGIGLDGKPAPKDAAAVQALRELVLTKQRDELPTGSVFKGGR